jgi:hypothetical protein
MEWISPEHWPKISQKPYKYLRSLDSEKCQKNKMTISYAEKGNLTCKEVNWGAQFAMELALCAGTGKYVRMN